MMSRRHDNNVGKNLSLNSPFLKAIHAIAGLPLVIDLIVFQLISLLCLY